MRLGILRNTINRIAPIDERFKQIGQNTGNMVFGYSLDSLLRLESVPYDFYNKSEYDTLDAIIITDLIWIREETDLSYLEKILDRTSIPLIPITLGFQANSYEHEMNLPEDTVRIIKRIAERATLGVRGEYTSKILEKYGIHNYSEIGCPSMYYWNNPNLKIDSNVSDVRKLLCNFRTIYGHLNQKEKHFLSYCASAKATFIEQTAHVLMPQNVGDLRYYEYVGGWLHKNKQIFFDINDWMRQTAEYDFSMGGRFHGNVISLWNNTKSLFVVVDARTRELTEHFKLPTINMQDFDKDKPIEYYYEMADYTEFNKAYTTKFFEFVEFLKKNNIEIVGDYCREFAKTKEEKAIYEKKQRFFIDNEQIGNGLTDLRYKKNREAVEILTRAADLLAENNSKEAINECLKLNGKFGDRFVCMNVPESDAYKLWQMCSLMIE